jgi:hypothetical protein
MDGPENAAEELAVAGLLLELDHFPVQTGQIFEALDQKLAQDIVFGAHESLL